MARFVYDETFKGVKDTETNTGVAMADRQSSEYFVWLANGNGPAEQQFIFLMDFQNNAVPVESIEPMPQNPDVWLIGVMLGVIDPEYLALIEDTDTDTDTDPLT